MLKGQNVVISGRNTALHPNPAKLLEYHGANVLQRVRADPPTMVLLMDDGIRDGRIPVKLDAAARHGLPIVQYRHLEHYINGLLSWDEIWEKGMVYCREVRGLLERAGAAVTQPAKPSWSDQLDALANQPRRYTLTF